MFLLFLVLLSASLISGCSSFYYHPTKYKYVDVTKMKSEPENIFISAKDGHKIHGWLRKTSQEKPKGVIVQFHGNAQNLTSHFLYLFPAPERGYHHIIFDYRGYGRSEGSADPENTVSDGKAVLRWA
ncbi:MAG: CocE/NonD family hydrolase, partial [Pseudomonadota bacterium]